MKNRRHIRIVVALKVALRDEPEAPRAYTKNLSAGGLFLLTERRWPPGTRLQLTLEHPGFEIEAIGEVTAHTQVDGVGVRFVVDSEQRQAALCAMLDFLLSSSVAYDGQGGLDGGSVIWRRDMLEHEGQVTDIFAGGAFIESNPIPQAGESVYVLLPSLNESGVREIVGSAATVSLATSDGFSVAFVKPSSEFDSAVQRLAQVLVPRSSKA